MNVAVIGVGSMGRNHARVLTEIEEANLVAIADSNPAAAERVARAYRVPAYQDYREMLERERPEMVVVAVPTAAHLEVSLAVIEAGCHLLLEKPIAAQVVEGEQIIAAARRRGVKLTIGHIERFNPAVLTLKQHLDAGELGRVFQLHARRVGPFPPRVTDVGVVMDLATHELNIMEYLTGSHVHTIYAQTGRQIHQSHEDLLLGLITFGNGTVGVLDINWLTPTKIRELSIIGEKGMFVVNYLSQDLYFYENAYLNGHWEELVAIMGVSEGRMIRHEVKRQEPLRVELQAFIDAIRSDRPPLISGEEGLRAIILAQRMIESGRTHQVLSV